MMMGVVMMMVVSMTMIAAQIQLLHRSIAAQVGLIIGHGR